jgi:hypothetical protein
MVRISQDKLNKVQKLTEYKEVPNTFKVLQPSEYSRDRKNAMNELVIEIEETKAFIRRTTKMKNTDKEVYAKEVIELVKEKGLDIADVRKVLSRAYQTVSAEVQSLTDAQEGSRE